MRGCPPAAGVQNIDIINLHKTYRLNEPFVKKIASQVLKACKKTKDLEFVFLDDRTIQTINRKYKRANRTTDVLSFDLGSLGEIFISLDRALENSRAFGTRFEDEIVLYVIHGVLHLAGYDDTTDKAKRRIRAAESKILKSICKVQKLSKVLTRR